MERGKKMLAADRRSICAQTRRRAPARPLFRKVVLAVLLFAEVSWMAGASVRTGADFV